MMILGDGIVRRHKSESIEESEKKMLVDLRSEEV
jgi:hypothetical protein